MSQPTSDKKEQLSTNQRYALNALLRGPLTTQQISGRVPGITWDSASGLLRRMEDRELVRRVGERPIKWELTRKGRNAL